LSGDAANLRKIAHIWPTVSFYRVVVLGN
jgi:hypothetical protein